MPSADSTGVSPDERHKNTTDERHTPVRLARQLQRAVGGFDLDPCSGCEPEPIADTRYVKADDGLSQPWFGRVVVNPPHSGVADWMNKLTTELARTGGPELIVALVPVRPSTDWFHDHATHAEWIGLFDERLSFGGTDGDAPFPSGLLVYTTDGASVPEPLTALMAARGVVYRLDDVSAGDLTAKSTLEDLLGETSPPEWASTVRVPAIGVGDPVTIGFETGIGFPSRVPDPLLATVVSIRPIDHHYSILAVADEPPRGAAADETYVGLTQRQHDPRDVQAVVCEAGTRGWRRVGLDRIQRGWSE